MAKQKHFLPQTLCMPLERLCAERGSYVNSQPNLAAVKTPGCILANMLIFSPLPSSPPLVPKLPLSEHLLVGGLILGSACCKRCLSLFLKAGFAKRGDKTLLTGFCPCIHKINKVFLGSWKSEDWVDAAAEGTQQG